MIETNNAIWEKELPQQLAKVLASIDGETAMQKFLRDVLTEKEILEVSARLEAAKMLSEDRTYADIIARTKLSSRTVARISDWMKHGSGGYALALKRLKDKDNG